MCTTRLQTVVLQWPPSDVAGGGSGPQRKKVEQVSSGDHQMLLAGGWVQGEGEEFQVCGLEDWDGGWYSEVQCIMGNGHIRTPHEQTNRH